MVRIHPKSIIKMKVKIKDLTSRSNGMGNEDRVKKLRRYIKGWGKLFQDSKHEDTTPNY
ncbi:hypothetical protein KQ941_16675 [Paenibacillus xylanexedens]|nr:hypothetical protein [Paenibacillus xylanexedens]